MLDNSEIMIIKVMAGECEPHPRILYQAKLSSEEKEKRQNLGQAQTI